MPFHRLLLQLLRLFPTSSLVLSVGALGLLGFRSFPLPFARCDRSIGLASGLIQSSLGLLLHFCGQVEESRSGIQENVLGMQEELLLVGEVEEREFRPG